MIDQDPLFLTVIVKAAEIEPGLPVQNGLVASTMNRRSTEVDELAARRETDMPLDDVVRVLTREPLLV